MRAHCITIHLPNREHRKLCVCFSGVRMSSYGAPYGFFT